MNPVLLLLAEDEAAIQIALQDVLEDGGYDVITASDGAEAVDRLNATQTVISGLISTSA